MKTQSKDKEPQGSKSSEEGKEPSLGVDMGLEEAVRVTAHGCLTIADIVRKSTGAAARRVSEIDANVANNSSLQGHVGPYISAAEIQKRRVAVESNAHRMSAAAYILEKLKRTLDGEQLGANMAALREYAEKPPRPPPDDRGSAHIMTNLLEEVSGPSGRRLRQQLANAREQLQALMILGKAAHFTPSESEDASNGADNSMAKQQANVLEDIFSLAVRVAKRSDTVLAAVQTSVRHHLVT